MAITRDAEQDAHFDPSACVEAMFRFFKGMENRELFSCLDMFRLPKSVLGSFGVGLLG